MPCWRQPCEQGQRSLGKCGGAGPSELFGYLGSSGSVIPVEGPDAVGQYYRPFLLLLLPCQILANGRIPKASMKLWRLRNTFLWTSWVPRLRGLSKAGHGMAFLGTPTFLNRKLYVSYGRLRSTSALESTMEPLYARPCVSIGDDVELVRPPDHGFRIRPACSYLELERDSSAYYSTAALIFAHRSSKPFRHCPPRLLLATCGGRCFLSASSALGPISACGCTVSHRLCIPC